MSTKVDEFKVKVSSFLAALRRDKKALLTVLIGLFGMALIFISELPESQNEPDTDAFEQTVDTEAELERLLSQVQGAGQVSVLISYENEGESIYAADEQLLSDENSSESTSEHVIVDGDMGESGLIIRRICPKVRGVAVVCQGGGDVNVRSEIVALVTALFDIGANRVSVAQGQAGDRF